MKYALTFGFWFVFQLVYSQTPAISYYGGVQLIMEKHCTSCHHKDGAAPFSLQSYEEVKRRANMIGYVTETGYMPPWKADASYSHFANERIMNQEEVLAIKQWIQGGFQKGNPKAAIKPTVFAAGSQMMRKPDLVLSMAKPYLIEGSGKATYIAYKIPFELPHDTFVNAIEFIPGNPVLVHHASCQVLEVADDVDVQAGPAYFEYGKEQRVNDAEDYAFFKLIGKNGQLPVEKYHYGWLPGSSPQQYPEGIGFRLPKKGVLIIRNLHYSPTPVPARDQSKLYLYYGSKPVTRSVGFAAFRPQKLYSDTTTWMIEADSIKRYKIQVRFHNDVSLLSINPHMHKLGQNVKVFAVSPSNDTIPLVYIPKWDFDWQEFYTFEKAVKIPAGSMLYGYAWFDNTSANPDNPFRPPQDVFFERGMDDTDEMMRLVVLYLPYQLGDELLHLDPTK